MLLRKLASAVLLAALASPAAAQNTIARCKAPMGHAYYFGGLGEPGWSQDGISDSVFELKIGKDMVDVVYSDAGGLMSLQGYADSVSAWEPQPGYIVVLGVLEDSGAETYLFDMRSRTMVLSQTRTSGMMPKTTMMVASCQ